MAEGRQEHDWWIASEHLAMLANVNRDPKKHSKGWTGDDMNPLKRQREQQQRTNPELDTSLAFDAMKRLWGQKQATKPTTPNTEPQP